MYIVATCIVAVFLSELTSAQIAPIAGVAAPVIPPVFPPMFGGFGFPFLGGFGFPFLGGLGFGRVGLGLGLGLGLGRFGLLRGKRDTNTTETPIKCFIASEYAACLFGEAQRMACEVQPRLTGISEHMKLRLVGLGVFPKAENEVPTFGLVSKQSSPGNQFTYVDPTTRKTVLLSVYSDETINKPGFLVKDRICFETLIKSLVEGSQPIVVDLAV